MDQQDKQCMYFINKGNKSCQRCETNTRGGIRMFCSQHHKIMLKWLKREETKNKEIYSEDVLLR